MTNAARIPFDPGYDREAPFASGNWAFDDGTRIAVAPAPAYVRRRIRSLVGWAFVIAATSSMSSCPDPWIESQQQRAQSTMAGAFEPFSRRRITLREARMLALEILYRAEEGRARAAQAEAERGIDWEEAS